MVARLGLEAPVDIGECSDRQGIGNAGAVRTRIALQTGARKGLLTGHGFIETTHTGGRNASVVEYRPPFVFGLLEVSHSGNRTDHAARRPECIYSEGRGPRCYEGRYVLRPWLVRLRGSDQRGDPDHLPFDHPADLPHLVTIARSRL